jgi:hypothetical protein
MSRQQVPQKPVLTYSPGWNGSSDGGIGGWYKSESVRQSESIGIGDGMLETFPVRDRFRFAVISTIQTRRNWLAAKTAAARKTSNHRATTKIFIAIVVVESVIALTHQSVAVREFFLMTAL